MADKLANEMLTRDEAAAYCGVCAHHFLAWVRLGIVPPKMPRTKRWDLKAIDEALDQRSGISLPTYERRASR